MEATLTADPFLLSQKHVHANGGWLGFFFVSKKGGPTPTLILQILDACPPHHISPCSILSFLLSPLLSESPAHTPLN
jgi:hypothetical protein